MALFRSASGPGGLSINTSSANMFGSTAGQQPASGGLFGSTPNASTPKPGGLFGTAAPTQQQPQSQATPSLFGATPTTTAATQSTTAQPQQQQTGSLFGAAQNQSQPATQGTPSLFGSTAQNQTQPQTQTTGGLFGTANASTAQPAAGATGSLGLFGTANASQQPASSLLGGSTLGQPAQPRPSLFGGLGQQPQSQPNSLGQSAFGQQQPQQQQQQQQQQPAVGLGGGLGFGLTMGQSNAQPAVPGVRIDVTNLKGTTRFNDLQEDLQKIIEQADTFITEQIRRKEEVDAFMSGHREMLESIPDDVTFVTRKHDGARSALESAAQSIEAARVLVNQDADNARLSFRAIDNLKLPQSYHTSGLWSPRQQASGNANAETDGQDLVGFFSKTADEMGEQMNRYAANLTEIELHMHGVSDSLVEQLQRMMATRNGASSGTDARIQELVAVLRDFEQGILKVAGDVGSAREGMTRLQLGDFMNHNDRDTNGVY
ncbi:hypothetical protein F5Y03DRAFT_389003 [Xylaria venustula]|nr:hypothetical protein F5Y03DRAFT_389003 [Xylaria venustula]